MSDEKATDTTAEKDTGPAKDQPIRNADGTFASQDARKVFEGHVRIDDWDFNDPPSTPDPDKDPLFMEAPARQLEEMDAGVPGADDDEPAQKRAAQSAAKKESVEDDDSAGEDKGTGSDGESGAGQESDEGDDLLATMIGGALPATEPDEGRAAKAKAGSPGGDDDAAVGAMLRRIGESNPELAAPVAAEMFGGKGKAKAKSAPGKGEGRDLRKVWAKAVDEGKDFDGIVEIVRETVAETLQPLVEERKAREAQEKFVRAKIAQFEVFKKKNPGWQQHRKRMAEVLDEIAKDLGPEAAARLDPERLLRLAAPGFKPMGVEEAAKAASQNKKAAAASRLGAPQSAKAAAPAGGSKGKVSRDQEVIDRTFDRLVRESRLRNLF